MLPNETRIASLFIPISILLSTGCSISPWERDERVLFNAAGLTLYREYRTGDGGEREALGFLHPVEISDQKLAVIFGRLRYKRKRIFQEPTDTNVFTPLEVERIAAVTSAALRELSPDERLRFLILRPNRGVFSIPGTSGVVFSKEEGTLDLAFDRIWDGVAGAEDGPLEVSFPYDPVEQRSGYPLVLMPGSRFHLDPETRETYPRWLEIDLAAVVPVTPPVEEHGEPEAQPPLDVEGAPRPASAEETKRYEKAASRIKLLKRLRADGALTEEEYRTQLEKALSAAE